MNSFTTVTGTPSGFLGERVARERYRVTAFQKTFMIRLSRRPFGFTLVLLSPLLMVLPNDQFVEGRFLINVGVGLCFYGLANVALSFILRRERELEIVVSMCGSRKGGIVLWLVYQYFLWQNSLFIAAASCLWVGSLAFPTRAWELTVLESSVFNNATVAAIAVGYVVVAANLAMRRLCGQDKGGRT